MRQTNLIKIYNQAAALIYRGDGFFACGAISFYTNTAIAFTLFSELFKPEYLDDNDVWFGRRDTLENQNDRATALLFMAEMAKTGDL